jgi:DNA-binding response OmpR family regulator
LKLLYLNKKTMTYNILIIEDEIETSKYLKLALEENSFSVDCAENGLIALQKIKQKEYDLIVLDLKMPEMSGDEVLKKIRESYPFLQVIVYTNYGDDSTQLQKLMNLGVDGFIKKGATADLAAAVNFIKNKLLPLDEISRKQLLNDFFQQLPVKK